MDVKKVIKPKHYPENMNWANVLNAFFDPEVGLLTRAYPDPKDREEFMKTDEYKAIRRILIEAAAIREVCE